MYALLSSSNLSSPCCKGAPRAEKQSLYKVSPSREFICCRDCSSEEKFGRDSFTGCLLKDQNMVDK